MSRRAIVLVAIAVGAICLGAILALPRGPHGGSSRDLALTDVTGEAGIDFQHDAGARGEMLNPETFGPGAGFLDFDGDGRQDLLIVNGNALAGAPDSGARSKLYRNLGDGRFADVAAEVGLTVPIYGMGFVSGDVDNDGDQDVLIYGLYRSLFFTNDGGKLRDTTESSGLSALRGWVGAAALLDYDRDGALDLFAGNYVQWSPERESKQDCTFGTTKKKYCPVAVFPATVPQLFHGRGDGAFDEVTDRSGLIHCEGKALGVAIEDYDRDGWPDIFVANDSVPNALLRNGGDGTFENRGYVSGFATDADGAALAGMGIDSAWAPDDGPLCIAIGNFAGEPVTFHVQEKRDFFVERSLSVGIGRATMDRVTFGLLLEDLDLDGLLDLTLVNGHVFDVEEITRSKYRQRPQIFLGRQWNAFEELASPRASSFLEKPVVGRALACADCDGDGDLDLVVTENQSRVRLFRNDLPGPHRAVRLALRGTRSNRDGIGAEVTLVARGSGTTRRVRRTLKAVSSYLSQSERALTFGLRDSELRCDAEVLWPSGLRESFRDVAVGRKTQLVEGSGEASTVASPAAGTGPAASAAASSIETRRLGVEHLQAKRFDAAIEAFGEAIRLDPHDIAAHRSRLVALQLAGRGKDVATRAHEIGVLFPDAGLIVSHFALVLRETRQPELAALLFAEAARLDPLRPDVWIALGNLAFDRKDYPESIVHFSKALALKPDAIEALSNTGKAYTLEKQYDSAGPFLERALALRPDYAPALSTLGGVWIERGDLDRAEALLTRALATSASRDTLLTVHGNLGILHFKRRDREKAIASFEKVLELDPADRQAKAALERLRR